MGLSRIKRNIHSFICIQCPKHVDNDQQVEKYTVGISPRGQKSQNDGGPRCFSWFGCIAARAFGVIRLFVCNLCFVFDADFCRIVLWLRSRTGNVLAGFVNIHIQPSYPTNVTFAVKGSFPGAVLALFCCITPDITRKLDRMKPIKTMGWIGWCCCWCCGREDTVTSASACGGRNERRNLNMYQHDNCNATFN